MPYEQCSTKYRNQCKKVPQQKCVTLKDLKCTDVWVEVPKTDLKILIISLSIIFAKIIIMIFLSLPFSSGAQDQKQEIVLLGGKKAPGQVLLQKVKYSKYSDNILLQKVRYSKYSDNLQICCTHQTIKIFSVASTENIESLFCSNNENI